MTTSEHFTSADLLNLLSHLLNRCEATTAWPQAEIDQIAYEIASQARLFVGLTGIRGDVTLHPAELMTAATAHPCVDFVRVRAFLDVARNNTALIVRAGDRIAALELIGKVQSIFLHGVTEDQDGLARVEAPEFERATAGMPSRLIH